MKLIGQSLLMTVLLYTSIFPRTVWAESNTSAQRAEFVNTMIVAIIAEDKEITKDAQRLYRYYSDWNSGLALSPEAMVWLANLSSEYKLKSFDINQRDSWHSLMSRVDIIPVSMALAQAINESAWGQSRFAKEGNNYFGIWCYKKGCGIAPSERDSSEKNVEVQRFSSMHASVHEYMNNLNTHGAYSQMRKFRLQLRERGGVCIVGSALIPGLSNYSSQGDVYVTKITHFMKSYQLEALDFSSELCSQIFFTQNP